MVKDKSSDKYHQYVEIEIHYFNKKSGHDDFLLNHIYNEHVRQQNNKKEKNNIQTYFIGGSRSKPP